MLVLMFVLALAAVALIVYLRKRHLALPNGLSEKHLYPIAIGGIGVFLAAFLLHDPNLPLAELFGERLLPLSLLLALALFLPKAFGGTKFDTISAIKTDPLAIALFLGMLSIAAAIVMAH